MVDTTATLQEAHTSMMSMPRLEEGQQKSRLAFRTISEVSEEVDVPQHVLRFWESKFSQIRPMKRGGGRRYYRPEDVELLRRIKNFLYNQGYTIKGVQKLLREARQVRAMEVPSAGAPNFVPYASPLASISDHGLVHAGLNIAPPTMASYLHAVAASPSAMALAHGLLSNTLANVQEVASPTVEFFADAFEQATAHLADAAQNEVTDQLTRSLDVVTQIYDELKQPIEPVRIQNAAIKPEDIAEYLQPQAVAPVEQLALDIGAPQMGAEPQEITTQEAELPKIELLQIVQKVVRQFSMEATRWDDERDAGAVSFSEFEIFEPDCGADVAVETPAVMAAPVNQIMAEPIMVERIVEIMPQDKKEALVDILAELVAMRGMLAEAGCQGSEAR